LDLAQQYGMPVPEEEASPQDRQRAQEQRQKQGSLTECLEKAAKSYQKHLRSSLRAITYLKGRGLTGEVAKKFGMGYAPEGWRALASVFGHYDDPQLVECGLVITNADEPDNEKRYDRFRDRIMFPIRNVKGECIGFGGRVLGDEKPKYLNSPETPVFSKGRELYGLYEARQSLRDAGFVLVTEGYMDVVALAQWGFPNAVATLGTACTNEHLQKLFRYTDSVVFSFDGDNAGRRAARKALDGAISYASDTRSIKFLFLPPEHDPDSFIREHGKESFSAYVAAATPLSQFLIDTAREGCALATAEGRAKLASQALPLWNPLPQGALKLQLLSEIADLVQLSPNELRSVWDPGSKNRVRDNSKKHHMATSPPFNAMSKTTLRRNASATLGHSNRSKGGTVSRNEVVCRLLVQWPELWSVLTNEDHAMLCAQPEPLGSFFVWLENECLAQGHFGSEKLQQLLPPESVFFSTISTYMTAQAATPVPQGEAQTELRDVLNRMLIEQIKILETESIEAAGRDPNALSRYRELQARRRQLETAIAQAVQSAH
jgi:DNA primase